MVGEQAGSLGLVLWQALRDVLLWREMPSDARKDLFHPPDPRRSGWFDQAGRDAPELHDALHAFRMLCEEPGRVDPACLAAACDVVWRWAEVRNLSETALQFAEAAANLEPGSSARSYTAGRLCRVAADYARGIQWFRRAERLARRAQPRATIDFANVHLGWGILEQDRGSFADAEWHFWKARRAALRSGRKSLAAAAHHNLIVLFIDQDRLAEAMLHAEQAIDLYPAMHPRVPAVASDIGYLWMRLGYFSTSTYLFSKALPWIAVPSDRAVVLSLFARAAAANRDRVCFERLAERALLLVAEENDRSDTALYHLAEGARSYEQWDRAGRLARQAVELARERKDQAVITASERLLEEIGEHRPGDQDAVHAEGGDVDRITRKVLTKMRRMPAPESLDPGTVFFPENYPPD